jgi:hypothetical protein
VGGRGDEVEDVLQEGDEVGRDALRCRPQLCRRAGRTLRHAVQPALRHQLAIRVDHRGRHLKQRGKEHLHGHLLAVVQVDRQQLLQLPRVDPTRAIVVHGVEQLRAGRAAKATTQRPSAQRAAAAAAVGGGAGPGGAGRRNGAGYQARAHGAAVCPAAPTSAMSVLGSSSSDSPHSSRT